MMGDYTARELVIIIIIVIIIIVVIVIVIIVIIIIIVVVRPSGPSSTLGGIRQARRQASWQAK